MDAEPGRNANVSWSILAATRFTLAMIVLNYHMVKLFGVTGWSEGLVQLGGKAAVIGFFAISGFSIHSSLKKDTRNFLRRRFIRVYPAYIVAIIASYLLRFMPIEPPKSFLSIDSNAVYLCNVLMLQMFTCKAIDYDLAVWSLSLEISFYVFIFIFRYMSLKTIIGISLISMALFVLPQHLSDLRIYALVVKFKPTKYIWPFLFGYLAFERRTPMWFVGFGAASALCAVLSPEIPHDENMSIFTIVLSVLAIWASVRWAQINNRAILYLGDVSYPLYLFHIPIMILLRKYLLYVNGTYVFIFCIVTSALAMKFAERPVRTLFDVILSRANAVISSK